jgi:hypothetical protein
MVQARAVRGYPSDTTTRGGGSDVDRDLVMAVVKPLFDRQACVSREEILASIEKSPAIPDEEKYVLRSLWKDDCYTYASFHEALQAYGETSPISFGSNLGGF